MDAFIKSNTPQRPLQQGILLIYHNGHYLCNDHCNPLHHTEGDLLPTPNTLIHLGSWHDEPVFLSIIQHPIDIINMSWQALRPLMLQLPTALFKLLGYASQIATWFINNQYCGKCGSPLQLDATEYRMNCTHCTFTAYPRLNPSMIILVTRGSDILLARSPHFTSNMYSTLAGFVEPGETVEQCVHREVFEEVNITVKNLRYMGSQSWPYPHSLMLGFHADYASGKIKIQPEEIEDAQWFNIKNLPELPPQQAISRYLIDSYIATQLHTSQPVLPN